MRVSLRDGVQQSLAIGGRDPQFLEILFGEARKGRNIDPAFVETGRILSQAERLQEVCDRGHDALQFPTRRSSHRNMFHLLTRREYRIATILHRLASIIQQNSSPQRSSPA